MSTEPHRDGGAVFWVATAVGWTVIAAAVVGVLSNSHDTQPADLVRWVIGGALVHDFLWLPLVALVGTALARATRGRVPGPVRWALATTAVLAVVSWPFVRGYGRQAANPSLLPRNYAAGVGVYVAVVWGVALLLMVIGTVARRRRPPAPAADPPTTPMPIGGAGEPDGAEGT
jgi:hypothetical protein